eukprot:jgi/Botrbrau1/16893/Bobra.150_2s0106.1
MVGFRATAGPSTFLPTYSGVFEVLKESTHGRHSNIQIPWKESPAKASSWRHQSDVIFCDEGLLIAQQLPDPCLLWCCYPCCPQPGICSLLRIKEGFQNQRRH